jgi:hypothetical protein
VNPDMPLVFDPQNPAALASEVFARVWRTTLDQPGFAAIRFVDAVDSHTLRQTMFGLVELFPERFVVERLGRFDQQVSSKFHRDGAPVASLLLLGYEPTPVRSRFWVADVSAAAIDEGLSLNEYLAAFNPMFPTGEKKLASFITEVKVPHGEPFLLAINNSQLSFDPVTRNPLGLLHKGVIPDPDPVACRVINSIGFTPAAGSVCKIDNEVERFLVRDDLD